MDAGTAGRLLRESEVLAYFGLASVKKICLKNKSIFIMVPMLHFVSHDTKYPHMIRV